MTAQRDKTVGKLLDTVRNIARKGVAREREAAQRSPVDFPTRADTTALPDLTVATVERLVGALKLRPYALFRAIAALLAGAVSDDPAVVRGSLPPLALAAAEIATKIVDASVNGPPLPEDVEAQVYALLKELA